MKAKNIYLIVIGIITSICVLTGCFINLGLPLIHTVTGIQITGKFGGEKVTESTLTESYSRIDIDAQALSINIVTGNENSFEYSGPKKHTPRITVDDGVATITQKTINPGINNSSGEMLLTITVNSKNLTDIIIDLDFGEISIDGINADNLWISADCGSIKVKNGSFTDTVVEADLGEVNFTNATFGKFLDINADCGAIIIKNPGDLSDANIEANTDLGNIKISVNDINYSGKSYKHKGSGAEIKLNADLGEITIE